MILISIVNFVAASIILFCGISSINKMQRGTCNIARIAWLALTTGSLGIVIAPIYGYPTLGWETTLNIGIALHVFFDRRKKARMATENYGGAHDAR